MSDERRSERTVESGEGRVWLTHRLLSLPAHRLAEVVGRILRGEDTLIRPAAETRSKRPAK